MAHRQKTTMSLSSGVIWFVLTTISQDLIDGVDVHVPDQSHYLQNDLCSLDGLKNRVQSLPSHQHFKFVYDNCQIYAYPKYLQKNRRSAIRRRSIQSSSIINTLCEDNNSHWNTTLEDCSCNQAYFEDAYGTCRPCVPCCPEDVQVIHSCQQQGFKDDICREVEACSTGTDTNVEWATVIIGIGSALLGFMMILILIVCLLLHRDRLQMRWRRLRDTNESQGNENRQQNEQTPEATSPDLTNFMPPNIETPDPNDSQV
ncbi:uncharacterized protein LOC102801142 [Saccoglossus kowalevskii]|uniref:Uncharacterized protein LOC102801142 n=1 Tax=Saccoglossus kowalevskii TaxID=10224 RepID=A0ABM0MTE6_SACKO|nr:PREDICTED: uncharacterized protein LOC102801142 [Saccoglossus kowalevskii]